MKTFNGVDNNRCPYSHAGPRNPDCVPLPSMPCHAYLYIKRLSFNKHIRDKTKSYEKINLDFGIWQSLRPPPGHLQQATQTTLNDIPREIHARNFIKQTTRRHIIYFMFNTSITARARCSIGHMDMDTRHLLYMVRADPFPRFFVAGTYTQESAPNERTVHSFILFDSIAIVLPCQCLNAKNDVRQGRLTVSNNSYVQCHATRITQYYLLVLLWWNWGRRMRAESWEWTKKNKRWKWGGHCLLIRNRQTHDGWPEDNGMDGRGGQ